MAIDYAALKAAGFIRQKQKGMFALRLHVVGGNLTDVQLKAVLESARRFGGGYIHLTSRQAVEIPFVKAENAEAIKAFLAKGGVEPSCSGPRVRTVTACQGGQCCPWGCIDALKIATELDRRYFGRQLPHKFKIGVTGCRNNCLKAEENDIGIKGALTVRWTKAKCTGCGLCAKMCRAGIIEVAGGRVRVTDPEKCVHCGRCVHSCPTGAWKGRKGFVVSFGGTFGKDISPGRRYPGIVESEAKLYRIVKAAIEFFAANAKPGERFAKTLERVPWPVDS